MNFLLQQAIGNQHGDAGFSTEESHDTTQTQQLVIPVQEQHPYLKLADHGGAGTSGIFNHVVEQGGARPRYQCGLHHLPYQREDDEASGWSRCFAGNRQGGSQATIREVGQVSNRLNTPVEEEGRGHGYDCGTGLQNRVSPALQKEHVTEHSCSTQELQHLSNETIGRQVV